jgi:hypothetical protein
VGWRLMFAIVRSAIAACSICPQATTAQRNSLAVDQADPNTVG